MDVLDLAFVVAGAALLLTATALAVTRRWRRSPAELVMALGLGLSLAASGLRDQLGLVPRLVAIALMVGGLVVHLTAPARRDGPER